MSVLFVKDPVGIIQSAGNTYVGNKLDQTYIVSQTLVENGEVITLMDTEGINKIQFFDGVEITESIVTTNEAQFNSK